MTLLPSPVQCEYCGTDAHELVRVFEQPPGGETTFGIDLLSYKRELVRCCECGHFSNRHSYALHLREAYRSSYRENAYGRDLRITFDRIMALSLCESSNRQRIQALRNAVAEVGGAWPGTLLDVGSGLGVFAAVMREEGWSVTALDLDPISTAHVRLAAGVTTVTKGLIEVRPSDLLGGNASLDLISFVKMLEHVETRVAIRMLNHSISLLGENGLIYVEVPDGEGAITVGPDRQEFFLEHFGAFSPTSFRHLFTKAGLTLLSHEKLVECTGKFVLRGLGAISTDKENSA